MDTETDRLPTPTIETLSGLRERIDGIDVSLIALLAERFSLTEKVGSLKAESGLSAEDVSRERWQQERYADLATSHRLDVETALQVMRTIVSLVKKRHVAIATPTGPGQP
jgi:chorismate mutase